MQLNTYLTFDGTCKEAFDFYAQCLGGKIVGVAKYSDAPPEQCQPGDENKIMHICLETDGGTLMGSDAPSPYYSKPQGFSVSINLQDAAKADAVYNALSEGGQIMMPIQETFWAERFAMFIDKYGTPWMINCMKCNGA